MIGQSSSESASTSPVVAQVLADTDGTSRWSTHALELLGDAAKLAKRLGGLTGAWVMSADGAHSDLASLAEHGADVIQRLVNARFARWSSESVAAALAASVSSDCRAVFLPGTARGEEVAALLAEHLGTVWIADVLTLSVTRSGTLEMTAVEPGGKLSRTYRAGHERPAVVTIRPGVAEAHKVVLPREPVVVDMPIDLSNVTELTTVERHLPADPRTVDIEFAPRIVAGGRGTGGPDGMRVVARLAEALGASLAASRMAVDLGWAPASRQVGQTGKTVRPDLYVACGISGASHHLAGMRDSKHIVAVNPDAAAPIHEVAHLSLYGDLHQIAPAVEAALRRRMS